jgi:hypothetical protein
VSDLLPRVVQLLPNFQLHTNGLPRNLRLARCTDGSFRVCVASVEWAVFDNGGEIGVERVNGVDLARFVPATWFGRPLGAVTLALRVAVVMRGDEIDFTDEWPDDEEALMTLFRIQ